MDQVTIFLFKSLSWIEVNNFRKYYMYIIVSLKKTLLLKRIRNDNIWVKLTASMYIFLLLYLLADNSLVNSILQDAVQKRSCYFTISVQRHATRRTINNHCFWSIIFFKKIIFLVTNVSKFEIISVYLSIYIFHVCIYLNMFIGKCNGLHLILYFEMKHFYVQF